MSGGTACKCATPNRVVLARNVNHSYFNPGPRGSAVWSAYSNVHCKACRTSWRTKAAYVDRLPDGST